MTARALLAACLVLGTAGSLSCAGSRENSLANPDAGITISCTPDASDNRCGSGLGYVAGQCVPCANSIANLAFEIAPASGSAPDAGADAAFTELQAADVSTMPLVLTANSTTPLTISFTSSAMPPTKVPTTASVILTVPPLIPGRPSLTYQATLTTGATAATLEVPAGVRGRHSRVSLLPLSPADQTSPPFAFDVDIPGSDPAQLTLDLPATSYTIVGILVDALSAGKGLFYARAFQTNSDPLQPGDLISTKTLTGDNSGTTTPGSFVMLLPAQIGSQPITTTQITVDLTPTSLADPWFRFDPFMLDVTSKNLYTIALPVYSATNSFQVTAHGTDPATGQDQVIAGATIRAYTKMTGGDTRGSTIFLRDATTDDTGTANLMLIPGDSRTARPYTLSVVPPPGSVWATACFTDVPVLWNGMATVPSVIPLMPLSPRIVVTGTVITASGTPVANVVVTATLQPPVPATPAAAATSPCLPGPTATTVTTDARGMFTLPLDPGSYQFDYDPPNGSATPRLTEFDVAVSGNLAHAARLPAPILVEGDVVIAGTVPLAKLPNATIRMFDMSMPRPVLRAQTQSDGNGHFRAVVALPP